MSIRFIHSPGSRLSRAFIGKQMRLQLQSCRRRTLATATATCHMPHSLAALSKLFAKKLLPRFIFFQLFLFLFFVAPQKTCANCKMLRLLQQQLPLLLLLLLLRFLLWLLLQLFLLLLLLALIIFLAL